MNPIRHLRRLAAAVAGLAGALLAFAAAAPAALADPRPRPIIPLMDKHPPLSPAHHDLVPVVRTVVVGGMPGWQIALIVIAAALLAATAAVLADRARARKLRATHSVIARGVSRVAQKGVNS
jgi:hypothetical protein